MEYSANTELELLNEKLKSLENERYIITKEMKKINTDVYRETRENEPEYEKLKKKLYNIDLEIISIKSELSKKSSK